MSRLWKDQVGSLKGLWLAQARRIGCQTSQKQKKQASVVFEKDSNCASVSEEWSVESCDIASSISELRDSSQGEEDELSNNREWKTECVAGLKLRRLLDAGKAWTHEELVNLVKSPGRCLCHISLFKLLSIIVSRERLNLHFSKEVTNIPSQVCSTALSPGSYCRRDR